MLIAMSLILAAGLLLAAAKQEKAENLLPCVLLMVISILFPFYCLNLLRMGRILTYIVLAATILASGAVLLRRGGVARQLRAVLTPGIALYVCLCLFALLYTKDNLVGLWDELRLWAAVPKAMYVTEQLQVGSDALIFPIMQSYPPGMPLLVYFLTALSPAFQQNHIFAVYGILFFTFLLPALKNLKWRQWPVLPLIYVLTALVPCWLTSHGGDFGWFYESLFIDPILGAAAGYVFYLAWSRPFDNWYSSLHFGMALLVLTILKDSGAMFAFVAAGCAMVVHMAEEKRFGPNLLRGICAEMPVAFGYLLWQWVLRSHGVTNNLSSFMRRLPPRSSLGALWKQLSTQPMIVLEGPFFQTNLTLTYFPCLLLLFCISLYAVRTLGKKRGISNGITWFAMLGSAGVFFLGYIISYHNAQPSFQRYTGSTLICMAVFTLLQSVPVLAQKVRMARQPRYQRTLSILALGAVMLLSCVTLNRWREKKWDIEYAQKHAVPAVSRILDGVESTPQDPASIYLLVSGNPASFSMAHHRIYFELLGTSACVRNFWNDVSILPGGEIPETWTQEEINETVRNWTAKLAAARYDYLYVITVDDYMAAALGQLGVTDLAEGDFYAIGRDGDSITLERISHAP